MWVLEHSRQRRSADGGTAIEYRACPRIDISGVRGQYGFTPRGTDKCTTASDDRGARTTTTTTTAAAAAATATATATATAS